MVERQALARQGWLSAASGRIRPRLLEAWRMAQYNRPQLAMRLDRCFRVPALEPAPWRMRRDIPGLDHISGPTEARGRLIQRVDR
jgi:hypothetical protein